MATRSYDPRFWELDLSIDTARFSEIAHCVTLVEDKLDSHDQGQGTDFAANYHTMIQASFLMVTIAFMEDQLKKLCDVVADQRNFVVRPTDMKGANGFTSCIGYLQKVLRVELRETRHERVRAIVDIRNAWVHNGGHLLDGAPPKGLGSTAKHLELRDGQIRFVGPFVQEACRICGVFAGEVEAALKAQTGPRRR